MILKHIIDIDETVKLTKGQGHKVKGQGHIYIYSGSRSLTVSPLGSPCNDPGSIPGPGGAAWIWVYYPCGSATSSARDVKQGCRLCTHAFKIMHGR